MIFPTLDLSNPEKAGGCLSDQLWKKGGVSVLKKKPSKPFFSICRWKKECQDPRQFLASRHTSVQNLSHKTTRAGKRFSTESGARTRADMIDQGVLFDPPMIPNTYSNPYSNPSLGLPVMPFVLQTRKKVAKSSCSFALCWIFRPHLMSHVFLFSLLYSLYVWADSKGNCSFWASRCQSVHHTCMLRTCPILGSPRTSFPATLQLVQRRNGREISHRLMKVRGLLQLGASFFPLRRCVFQSENWQADIERWCYYTAC